MKDGIRDILGKRILLLDGAMGTMLHQACAEGGVNEELCLTKPGIIADIHRLYLDAGSDIITTNTFGASSVVLSGHGLEKRAAEINLAAAAIARSVADAETKKGRPRFVAGDIGPGSALPSLSHISFDELFDSYLEQAGALIDGGIDCILVETCQDPLQAKAALSAARAAALERGKDVPLFASMTVEKSATMLLGTELTAALASLAPFSPAAFGINCATGPEAMEEHIRTLALESPFPILVQPNAGMPENVGGKPVYPLSPERFAEIFADLVRRFKVAVAGGCCGTTPDHIRELARMVREQGTGSREQGAGKSKKVKAWRPSVSSLYTAAALDQEPRPFLVAEQTNVNGSRKFRELLLAEDYDAMAEVAQRAAAEGHALDLCLSYAGRDEVRDYGEALRRISLKADAAIMVDSTDPAAIERALSCIPGRAIINSINLEDGGAKARRILSLARRFGAAVVALTIDEDGMARLADRKLSVAKRLLELSLAEGLEEQDLLFDPLTFTLASGDEGLRDAAVETLNGLQLIKKEIPGAKTILGVSNISFGLSAAGRRMLTSVFLDSALKAGLDAAIINPSKILPLDAIPEDARRLCAKLVMNDRSGGDPLFAFIDFLKRQADDEEPTLKIRENLSPEEELRGLILDGNGIGLARLVDDILSRRSAAEVLNAILLPAMQEVGRRFGEGRLALPFVLHSAEAMRAAVDILSPHLAAGERGRKGTMVLATVRGDVHDIGKNLVDAILSNNGFKVVNLGIRQSAAAVAKAAIEHRADAIGLSGLLVSSTEVMREDLELFREGGIRVPVLCGGAALTPSYVNDVLSPAYGGKVYYCADAFDGLMAMEEIAEGRGQEKDGSGRGKRS